MNILPSSYRDPGGFVFEHQGRLLRQINASYRDNYDHLLKSGLYGHLVKAGSLISHKEVDSPPAAGAYYKIIEPELIPFISYPYEWCFSQLKDAALLTLQIQKESLEFGMSLKDASSFNIQFYGGRPIFIDTLSFEIYEEGKPWVAYRQFCEQFLAPLALLVYTGAGLGKISQIYPEGVPLDLAVKLLPLAARIRPALFLHLVLHARSQRHLAGTVMSPKKEKRFDKNAFMGLVESLSGAVGSLHWKEEQTVWSNYYRESNKTSYRDHTHEAKKAIVEKYLDIVLPKTLWDIGANTGVFSQIAAKRGILTISMDSDISAVEKNYVSVRKKREKNILPLWLDIVNPTPGVGWENSERSALLGRPMPDAVLALAFLHHLALGYNLPLSYLSSFFARICRALVIEFVPKEDQQVTVMLQNREDIFDSYNQVVFEREFGTKFVIREKSSLPDSRRSLYLMVHKGQP